MQISKWFTFHAAHQLVNTLLTDEQNKRAYGKCNTLHGHSYRLQVTVEGEPNPLGMVMNFSDLEKLVEEEIIRKLDHQFINKVIGYKTRPTTAENILDRMWQILSETLRRDYGDKPILKRLVLNDNDECSATMEK